MPQIVIDKKKYVLMSEEESPALQRKAALKTRPEKLFTAEEARIYSYELIKKWAVESK